MRIPTDPTADAPFRPPRCTPTWPWPKRLVTKGAWSELERSIEDFSNSEYYRGKFLELGEGNFELGYQRYREEYAVTREANRLESLAYYRNKPEAPDADGRPPTVIIERFENYLQRQHRRFGDVYVVRPPYVSPQGFNGLWWAIIRIRSHPIWGENYLRKSDSYTESRCSKSKDVEKQYDQIQAYWDTFRSKGPSHTTALRERQDLSRPIPVYMPWGQEVFKYVYEDELNPYTARYLTRLFKQFEGETVSFNWYPDEHIVCLEWADEDYA